MHLTYKGNNLGSLPLLTGRDVFHVPTNDYTLKHKLYAKHLVENFRLEFKEHNTGEWCSYGWSKDKWHYFTNFNMEKLQTIDGHKNDCGRPGINGEYIENKNARYGVGT